MHLLTVWNPSYASDAMEAHLDVLLRWSRQAREEDEVYVWWAKLRSQNRQGPLPHLADVLALDAQVDEAETHLYLTDFRSLYVGLVEEITADDVLAEDEADHAPAYYQGRNADCWFKLVDIRRLVLHDTPAVIAECAKLANTRYGGRPVSLYGGIHELPLLVTREDDVLWFEDREELIGGRLWAERDAELVSATEQVAADLRDNVIGPELWAVCDVTTRSFLATAEALYRSHRDDLAFDFAPVAVEYAKAVESEANALLFAAARKTLRSRAPKDRTVNTERGPLDLGGPARHQTLGTLVTLLKHEPAFQNAVRAGLGQNGNWAAGVLGNELESLVSLRNPAAHGSAMQRADVSRHRATILGIGCDGLIPRLARARLKV